MAYAVDTYTGDGSKVEFDLTFPYIQRDHVKVVRIDGDTETALTVTTGTPSGDQYSWEDNDTIKVGTAPTSSQQLKIYRDTPDNAQIVQWQDGSYIVAVDLNTSDRQWLYLIQENNDLIKAIEDLIPTVGREAITEAQATKDPTDPAWSGDERLATVGAISRLFSQVVGTGSGFPGDGNLGFNGKLRIDNVTNSTPDLFFWDAAADTPAWVQVNTKGDKGDKGDTGETGPAPGLQDPATSVSNVPVKQDGKVGDASVSVTQDADKDLLFTFGIPVGETGAKGEKGDIGPAPGLQDPAATASNVPLASDGSLGNATASVSQDADKKLKFQFGIPVGQKGDKGDTGEKGEKGDTGSGVTYLGSIDATTASAPSDPSNGDFWVNTTAGTSSWPGLSTVTEQDRLVFNSATDKWDRYAPVASRTNLGYTKATDKGTITNDNGDDAVIVTASSDHAGLMTPTQNDKLAGIAEGAEANVQVDWDETDSNSDSFIKNKPEIKQSDWNETDNTSAAFIQNKPTIPNAQEQADWAQTNTTAVSFIKNKPTIPDAPVQSNWNETDTNSLAFIQNKPDVIQSDWNQTNSAQVDFIKNKPTIGNGQINFNAGNGLTSTGDNATANQSGNTTKTFTVEAANNTINVASDGISVNQTTLNGLYLPLAGGTMTGTTVNTVRTITAQAFDLSTGNIWSCGSIVVPNPTNATAGTSGLISFTGSPTGWGDNFQTPGGDPLDIDVVPAIVPFYVLDAGTILLGNPTTNIS